MTTTNMKRYTSLKSNLFSPHSSNIVSQNLVYMQMSHHYRRLLNAKSNVDSSQPRSFRAHERQRCSRRMSHVDTSRTSFVDEPSPSEMALVDRMVYDDKHGPDVIYRDHLAGTRNHNHPHPSAAPRHDCTKARIALVVERPKPNLTTCRQRSTQRTANKPPPCDLIDRHCDDFESADPYKPRILKSTAQSRVRDLKVYHPPRRKPKLHKAADWDIQTEVQQQHEEERVTEADEWLQNQTLQTDVEQPKPLCAQCQCEMTHEQPSSKVSIGSRDSAYNGGVSSGGESRGPTPEQINLANMSISRSEESPDSQLSTVQSVEIYNVSLLPSLPSVPPHLSKRDHEDWFPSSTSRSESMQSTTDRDKTKDRPSPCLSSRRCVKKRNKTLPTDLRISDADDSVATDDVRYAAFSERITTDILCREILSNKGINKLFRRHIEENMGLLDMTLMQKEIDMLRVQLGIEGNDDSDMNLPLNSKHNLYPSFPAPCTTQYFNLSMRNQLVQTVDSSQTLEIPDLADNENELKSLTYEYDYETLSPKTIVKEGVDMVSTEIQTETDSEVFIEDTSSDTNTDASSLQVAMREILDQILTDNISSIPNLIAEPVVSRENSVVLDDVLAIDDATSEIDSDHSHQSGDTITDVEVEESRRSLPEDKFFSNNWVSNSLISCSKKEFEQYNPTTATPTNVLDNPATRTDILKGATDEAPSVTNSRSDTQTHCCFIKKKKEKKDDHKPKKNDKKLTQNCAYLEKALRQTDDRLLGLHTCQDDESSTISTNPNSESNSEPNEHVSDEELSWAEMDSKSSHLPHVSTCSTTLSSKSSLGAVPSVPSEAPRVRKLSDSSTRRRRSTYLEASSSSSSINSSLVVKNFRDQVRKSTEAHQKQ